MPTLKAKPPVPEMQGKLISQKSIEEGWTQTEIGVLDECGYKWYLMFNLMLSGSEAQWYYATGGAWHQIMENIYRSGGTEFRPFKVQLDKWVDTTPEVQALQEQWERTLEVYAEEYIHYFGERGEFASLQITGIEQIQDLETTWKGQKIRLKGMVDLKGNRMGNEIMYDHKTTNNITGNMLRGWEFRFQFMFYWWLNQQIEGKRKMKFIVNIMRKPSIRVKKSESLRGYLQRLRGEIRREPLKYFHREPLNLTKGKMEKFESEVLAPKLNKIALIQDPNTPQDILSALVLNRNGNACINPITGAQCVFLEICDRGMNPDRFTQRPNKHPELAGE